MAVLAYPVGGGTLRRRPGQKAPGRLEEAEVALASDLWLVNDAAGSEGTRRTKLPSSPRAAYSSQDATIYRLYPESRVSRLREAQQLRSTAERVTSYSPITPLRYVEESPARPTLVPARTDDPALVQEREIARRVAMRRRARLARLRRRRLRAAASATATIALVVGVWVGADALVSFHAPALQVLPGSVKSPGGYLYTVQAGDTIWSISSRLVPAGDPRPIADRLESEVGGTVLQPGVRLLVP